METPKFTITISRQMGSLGSLVARETAQRLGYRLMWRELINQAAHLAGAPEVALAAIDELGLLGISPSPKAYLAYRQALQKVMEEQADQGNVVIVGRAGQAILHGRPDVLHVRVIAPADLRARRIAERQEITLECAQAQVEASDRSRQSFLRRSYHVRWEDPQLYDLTINTERLTSEEAVGLICQLVASRTARQPMSSFLP